jgi:galacturan 1,4-alpha-galacturonidase
MKLGLIYAHNHIQININAFTVPAGKTLAITALDGTTVNLLGDVKFGVANWAGPLFSIAGNNLVCEFCLA